MVLFQGEIAWRVSVAVLHAWVGTTGEQGGDSLAMTFPGGKV